MWRYAAASTAGLSHLKTDTLCQDRYAHAIEGGDLIIAVADGAHLSDAQADWPALVVEAALAARSAVQAEASGAGRPARDYACTLLVIVLANGRGAALQIGDGVIVYKDAEAWGYVFWPQKGEYANTTNFLIQDDAEARFEVTALNEPLREIAVMTDGLEGLALHYASQAPHEPFLEAVMTPLRAARGDGEAGRVSAGLEAFLRSDRITSRTDDDLTLVLATRVAE